MTILTNRIFSDENHLTEVQIEVVQDSVQQHSILNTCNIIDKNNL